jgi:hypothetical protein
MGLGRGAAFARRFVALDRAARVGQPLDDQLPLAPQAQPLPGRDEDLDAGRALQHLRQQRGVLEEVLEVVQHEQEASGAEVLDETLLGGLLPGRRGELERPDDDGREQA